MLLLAGSGAAGLGWCPAFIGAYRSIVGPGRPVDRAGLVAAIFAEGYLAFSVPAVTAVVASSRNGLHDTALVHTSVVAVLAAESRRRASCFKECVGVIGLGPERDAQPTLE